MKSHTNTPQFVILSEAKDLAPPAKILRRRGPIRINRNGFTLIELSIVLVIIGLIVGGVLVGQDLIRASEVRAQITQIEKYNSAVNTFRGKFNAIPGDMPVATAQQFGFMVGTNCAGAQGQRDGNGLLDGYPAPSIYVQGDGETALFWVDLSSSLAGNLIESQFPNSGGAAITCTTAAAAIMSKTPGATFIGNYLPAAKIGNGNYIYVYESSGANWYGLSVVSANDNNGDFYSSASISVRQAYNIDSKIDDGIPNTGNVQASYLNGGNSTPPVRPNNAASDTATTCYNSSGPAYSITYNNGTGGNCALSFKMQ